MFCPVWITDLRHAKMNFLEQSWTRTGNFISQKNNKKKKKTTKQPVCSLARIFITAPDNWVFMRQSSFVYIQNRNGDSLQFHLALTFWGKNKMTKVALYGSPEYK